MSPEGTYTIGELADLADVTPRTIRYYVAQGLLASPVGAGPGARYDASHLARLRLIRRLQAEHLPLAEIRRRLSTLSSAEIEDAMVSVPTGASGRLGPRLPRRRARGPGGAESVRPSSPSARRPRSHGACRSEPSTSSSSAPSTPERSQWDRIQLDPDIELHVRRPLSRIQHKRVERLVELARQILEEDPS